MKRLGAADVTGDEARNPESRLARLRVVSGVPAPPQETSERELVALLREHDERGFDAAYARYAERVFGFLVRLARSRTLAEDLFQQTFMRLAEHGPSLRPDSDLRAWLFTVARNAFHSHARSRGVVARADSWFPLVDDGTATESSLTLSELDGALARLSTDDRELLLLVGVEGLDPQEVASMLLVPPAVLRKRLSRARARLADALDRPPALVRKSEVRR